jgi:hypothetical protein
MTPINKLGVAWSGLRENVSSSIRKGWRPGELGSEIKYRDSLAAFLREAAPGARVEVEYRHKGTTTDIYLKWSEIVSSGELFIEMKYNLRNKSEYDRLVGQIEQLDPKSNQLLLVLCGEQLNDNLLARLEERYVKTGDLRPPLEIILTSG